MAGKKKQASNRPKIRLTGEQMEQIVGGGGLSALSNRELPPKVSYWIARITSRIQSEWKIYVEERMKVIEKFVDKDEKGEFKFADEEKTRYDITPETEKELNEALKELRGAEIVLDIQQLEQTADEIIDRLEEKEINVRPLEITALLYFTQGEDE